MTATNGIASDTRLAAVLALIDEAARVRPDVPRVELVRAITKRRNFEMRLKAGRVTQRQLEDTEGALCHWLGIEG